jgi:hypothetical protein
MTKLGGGIAALGAGWYGLMRIVKRDRREDTIAAATDGAVMQVIATLREEVERLTKRLELVEEQNRRCEERNDALHFEIVELKARLHVT